MSATCQFCGAQFGNVQGVRAHLKACSEYRERPAKAERKRTASKAKPLGNASDPATSLGNSSPDNGETFDPVKPLQQRLASEKLRLQLREVDDAHAEMDSRKREKDAERARAEELARASAQDEQSKRETELDAARAANKRETVERERSARHRRAIQDAKREAVDNWHLRSFVETDVRARIFQTIERELALLPTEELPLEELKEIAQGVRDKIYRDVEQAKKAARAQTEERARLIRHGGDYASRELFGVDDLDILERMSIEAKVTRALESVEGDESEGDIEDFVDELLEEEGIGWEEEDE